MKLKNTVIDVVYLRSGPIKSNTSMYKAKVKDSFVIICLTEICCENLILFVVLYDF